MAPSKEDLDRLGNYAAMLAEDDNIDRHLCHRVVPMQVLSLGFSRTGTMCTSSKQRQPDDPRSVLTTS